MKKRNWKLLIGKLVLLSFIIPLGYIAFKLFDAPLTNDANIEGLRVKADYVLMFIQCLAGIVAMILPAMISKKNKIEIPSNMYLVFILFLYAAIFLGEVRNFYYDVPHWDTILHTFSGAMLGALGFSFINLLNNNESFHLKLSPIFVALFAFSFAIMLGVAWEIYEFTFDSLLGLNMQKFALETGELLQGRLALMDTMKDLIVDAVGAFIMSMIGYISLKYKTGWFENFLFKFKAK